MNDYSKAPPGDADFSAAYSAWSEAFATYEASEDKASGLDRLTSLFEAMVETPASNSFDLFRKLEAMRNVPWTDSKDETGFHLDRLIADAGTAATQPAKAWIDRWKAIGGDFGYVYPQDGPPTRTRGMLLALDLWKPTDRGRQDLPPHTWLEAEEHHTGALKVLEGLLVLVPGLQDAVFALADVPQAVSSKETVQ